jgi:hypothetical protein
MCAHEALILVSGRPRRLTLLVPAASAGAAERTVHVDACSAEAAVRAISGISDARLGKLREALVDASTAAARPANARVVPLVKLLEALSRAYEAQLAENRDDLDATFDGADTDADGAVSSAELTELVLARDSTVEPSALAQVLHRVHDASELIEPAVGDALLKEAYVRTMMRGAPGLVPRILPDADAAALLAVDVDEHDGDLVSQAEAAAVGADRAVDRRASLSILPSSLSTRRSFKETDSRQRSPTRDAGAPARSLSSAKPAAPRTGLAITAESDDVDE